MVSVTAAVTAVLNIRLPENVIPLVYGHIPTPLHIMILLTAFTVGCVRGAAQCRHSKKRRKKSSFIQIPALDVVSASQPVHVTVSH